MKCLFLSLLLSLFLCSCNKNLRKLKDNTILVAENLKDSTNLQHLFTDFEYVALETTEESLFGNIDKLIYSEGKYYIMDGSGTRKIFVFSEEGTFLRTIGKTGKGPGEYTQIVDFTIDEKNNLVIILAHPSTAIVYNEDGHFIHHKELVTSGSLWSIINYENGYLCSTDHNSYVEGENAYLIFDFDKEFNLLEKSLGVLSMPMNMLPLISNPFSRNEDGIAYFDFFSSKLHYNLCSKNPQSVYFDFKEKKVPVDVLSDPMVFFNNQNKYGFFSDGILLDNLFFSTFILSGKRNVALFNTDTNYSKLYKYNGWVPELLYYKDGAIFSTIEPTKIIDGNIFFDNATNTTKYSIKEDSNPVILKFKPGKLLKKD